MVTRKAQQCAGRVRWKCWICCASRDRSLPADALHCHRAFAAAVLARGGDYVLAIKANRGPLFRAVEQQFTRSGKRRSAQQVEPSGHDRREVRRATIMRNTSLAAVHDFPGVVAMGRITSRRRRRGHRADPPLVRHYLLSRYLSPKRFLQVARSHWGTRLASSAKWTSSAQWSPFSMKRQS
jgi:hypothetical protein